MTDYENNTNKLAPAANPFGSAPAVNIQQGNAIANSDMARSVQEVQASMMIAKSFPRDPLRAMDNIMNACTRASLAEVALYSYKRGGTDITGPSIRLLEVCAQYWGNIQSGVRELSSANGVSVVEAFARDLETNSSDAKVFQVEHVRYSKSGGLQKLTDPRDIYELVANSGARRKRACMQAVIPGDVIEAAQRQCEITQANNVDLEPEAIKAVLADFLDKFGVSQELIEKRIGRRAEAINGPLMLNLKRIGRSLMDGMSKPSDWFDIAENLETVGPQKSGLADALQKQAAETPTPPRKPRASRKKAEEPAPAATTQPGDQGTGPAPAEVSGMQQGQGAAAQSGWPKDFDRALKETIAETDHLAGQDNDMSWLDGDKPAEPEVLTYAMVADAINKIDTTQAQQKAINLMSQLIGETEDSMTREAFKVELGNLYRKKIAELNAARAK